MPLAEVVRGDREDHARAGDAALALSVRRSRKGRTMIE